MGYGFTGIILRFVSVLGGATRTDIFTTSTNRSAKIPTHSQCSETDNSGSHIYVGDTVEGITLLAGHHQEPGAWIYNIGTDEVTTVDWSVQTICEHLGVEPEIVHTQAVNAAGSEATARSHPPRLHTPARARLGAVAHDCRAVDRTLHWFDENEWVFDSR